MSILNEMTPETAFRTKHYGANGYPSRFGHSKNKLAVSVVPMGIEIERLVKNSDNHEVLGIEPTATPREIRAGFRRLAKRYHPDKNSHPKTVDAFHRISQAYHKLMNPNEVAAPKVVYTPRYDHTVYNPFTKTYTPYSEVLKQFEQKSRSSCKHSSTSGAFTACSNSFSQCHPTTTPSRVTPNLAKPKPTTVSLPPNLAHLVQHQNHTPRKRHYETVNKLTQGVDVAAVAAELLARSRKQQQENPSKKPKPDMLFHNETFRYANSFPN